MSDVPEMVDRVQNAIDAAWDEWCDGPGEGLDCDEVPTEVLARAAIAAMREPPKSIIAAGNDQVEDGLEHWGSDSMGENVSVSADCALGVWQAMIDAALTPPQPPGS